MPGVGPSGALNSMNGNKATILLILLMLASSSLGQQRTDSPSEPQSLRTFTEVKGRPEHLPSSFEFSTSGYKFRILSTGRGRRTGGGVTPRSFNLRLDNRDSLDRNIYYAEHGDDLLLICEVSDGESGAGFITRLDSRTLRMKWKQKIPAFNLGQGLIESDHAYLTAIGFIARINLQSGAYAWKHNDLYRDGDFNSFKLPALEGDIILFKEEVIYDEPAKTIKVQKQSGKIISIG